MVRYFFLIFSLSVGMFAQDLRHIPYLCKKGLVEKAIDIYLESAEEGHKHEILMQIALNILEEGSQSKELEKQLITLYGIGITRISDKMSFLKRCIKSEHPNVQLAAIHLLGELHEDETDEILTEAMSSPYFPVRIEALYRLCKKKSRFALSHVESLKNLIPDEYGFFFPDFLAMIGSVEAMSTFKTLFTSSHLSVRIATIASAAKFGRDDFLPIIRLAATHPSPAEQEAAVASLGSLMDLHSIDKLKDLAESKYEDVRLASLLSLIHLGHHEYEIEVKKLALKGNPFAVYHLKDLPLSKELLKELAFSQDALSAINATIALVDLQDINALGPLKKILIDLPDVDGFIPISTSGRSLIAWKYVPGGLINPKYQNLNIDGITLSFKENLLIQSLDLKEEAFLEIADAILTKEKQELIPATVRLLENISNEKAIQLLKENAQKPGSPLTRGYCLLALYRMTEEKEYKEQFFSFMKTSLGHPLIQFRTIVDRSPDDLYKAYELTPEVHSRLLLEAYEAMALKRDPAVIDQILLALKEGHKQNRPALAGLLLNALQ